MTPEERFNKEIWWILQEIKKEYLTTLSGEKVSFQIRVQFKKINKDEEPIPSPDTQRKLLDKLEEWKAFDLEVDSGFDI
jgi:DNA-directed RNA polymerase sigma subunit (sigma70/sigma32)